MDQPAPLLCGPVFVLENAERSHGYADKIREWKPKLMIPITEINKNRGITVLQKMLSMTEILKKKICFNCLFNSNYFVRNWASNYLCTYCDKLHSFFFQIQKEKNSTREKFKSQKDQRCLRIHLFPMRLRNTEWITKILREQWFSRNFCKEFMSKEKNYLIYCFV